MSETLPESAGYPIRVVARRTGLKQDAIRAWERRYKAVVPSRSDGHHRLYSEADIRRLQLLRRATEAGHSIGQIAALPEADLLGLLEADAADREDPTSRPSSDGNPYLSRCLEAVTRLDREALEEEIQRGALEVGRSQLIDQILVPLVAAIGKGYEEGTIRPMHEHLVSSVVAHAAQSFRPAFPPADTAPRLLISTPVHQHHELGAVLAAGAAASEGWQATFLGPNLPAEEIAAAARVQNSTAVALSIVFPPDDPALPVELRRLRKALPDVPILVGGRAAASYSQVLAEIDAVLVEDFKALRSELANLQRRRSSTLRSRA